MRTCKRLLHIALLVATPLNCQTVMLSQDTLKMKKSISYFLLFFTLFYLGSSFVYFSPKIQAQEILTDQSSYFHLYIESQNLYERSLSSSESNDFTNAAIKLEKLVDLNPDDGKLWTQLGDVSYLSGNFSRAVESYQKSYSLGHNYLDGGYRYMAFSIAASYAQLDETEKALEWLHTSLYEERLPFRQQLLDQPAFANLREDESFRELISMPQNTPDLTRVEGWRHDLNYLLSEIKRLNIDYSVQEFPDLFQQEAERLYADIPNLPDEIIWVRMQQLLALLNQSHNGIWHSLGAEKFEITMLPVTLYIFNDGLFIIDAEEKALIGAKVIGIGNSSTDEALEAIESVAQLESPMEIKWLGPEYLRMPSVFYALGLHNSFKNLPLLLEMASGDIEEINLDPIPVERRRKLFASKIPGASDAPLYLSQPDTHYWFKPIPDEDLVYFQFNQVVNDSQESLRDFSLRFRQFLQEQNVKNLIVDLRRNNGGDTFLYTELLRTILWFDTQNDSRLYVIIGRNTYSAAQNFATDLERLTTAIFLGEPSGSRPNTHGDEVHIILPYSGLNAGLSSGFWQHSHPRDIRFWIAPDIRIDLHSKEYFLNQDPVLDYLIFLLGELKKN